MSAAPDFARTRKAETNRHRKAKALAAAAVALGLQPYELAIVGGGEAERAARRAVRRRAGLDRDPSVESWHVAMGYLEGRARSLPAIYTCPGCGWPVLWVVTQTGASLLLDPFPHPEGSVVPVESAGLQYAHVLAADDPRPADTPRYRLHVASCPARRLTRPREEVRPMAELCPSCGGQINPETGECRCSD